MTGGRMDLRAHRQAAGMSLGQLARAAVVSTSAVHWWEEGRSVPSANNARKVAAVLGVPVAELFPQTREPGHHNTPPPKPCSVGRCVQNARTRGLCPLHYNRYRRGIELEAEIRRRPANWPLPVPPLPDRPEPDWEDRAACRGMDPELFYDEVTPEVIDACSSCDVRASCLLAALRTGEVDGIRGGMSPWHRLKLTRRLRKAS